MRGRFFGLLFVFLFLPLLPPAFPEEPVSLPPFNSTDRVLILAPHPDDETLGAGGALRQAVKAGARVKVVLLTNGENNVRAFFSYNKRIFFTRDVFLEMGKIRNKETAEALKSAGLEESALISLGYPDFGTLKILTRHWGDADFYRALTSRWNYVPFEDALSPGVPYSGENILKDLTRVLVEYQPTKIFVSHPADENRDHRALYLFTRIALWDLEGKISPPQIYPYLIHLEGWPSPQGFRPELEQTIPPELSKNDISWKKLTLNLEDAKEKHETVQRYPSQIPYAPQILPSYVRASELFGDYPDAALVQDAGWQEMKNYNPLLLTEKTAQQKFISKIAYAREKDRLLVKVELKFLRNRVTGVGLFLFGYKKGVPFEKMPKIEIFTRLNTYHVKDKMTRVSKKEVKVTRRGRELLISLPLSMMGDPDFILSSARTRRAWDLSIDETAWRILSLKS